MNDTTEVIMFEFILPLLALLLSIPLVVGLLTTYVWCLWWCLLQIINFFRKRTNDKSASTR